MTRDEIRKQHLELLEVTYAAMQDPTSLLYSPNVDIVKMRAEAEVDIDARLDEAEHLFRGRSSG